MLEYSLMLSLLWSDSTPCSFISWKSTNEVFGELDSSFSPSSEMESVPEGEEAPPTVPNWHQVGINGPFEVPTEAKGLGYYGVLIVNEQGSPTDIIHYKENASNLGEWNYAGYDSISRYYEKSMHPLGVEGEGPRKGGYDFWYIPPSNFFSPYL